MLFRLFVSHVHTQTFSLFVENVAWYESVPTVGGSAALDSRWRLRTQLGEGTSEAEPQWFWQESELEADAGVVADFSRQKQRRSRLPATSEATGVRLDLQGEVVVALCWHLHPASDPFIIKASVAVPAVISGCRPIAPARRRITAGTDKANKVWCGFERQNVEPSLNTEL